MPHAQSSPINALVAAQTRRNRSSQNKTLVSIANSVLILMVSLVFVTNVHTLTNRISFARHATIKIVKHVILAAYASYATRILSLTFRRVPVLAPLI